MSFLDISLLVQLLFAGRVICSGRKAEWETHLRLVTLFCRLLPSRDAEKCFLVLPM